MTGSAKQSIAAQKARVDCFVATEEAQCLSFFKILRQSLVLILEEDKKKREELEMQQELEKAITGFSNPGKEQPSEK